MGSTIQRAITKVNVNTLETAERVESDTLEEVRTESNIAPINGWIPDSSKECYGLPGAVAPTGYFDPIGFAQKGISLNDVKRYREAEVQHGRVAMIASVGYLAGEAIQGPFSITGPANDQLAQVPLLPFLLLSGFIGAAELKRATIGWSEPTKFKS